MLPKKKGFHEHYILMQSDFTIGILCNNHILPSFSFEVHVSNTLVTNISVHRYRDITLQEPSKYMEKLEKEN